MYIILVEDNNTLYATQTQRIMQRSKLVDRLVFITEPTYQDLDLSKCTVLLEYVTASNKYRTEFLVQNPEGYKDYLKYVLPIDTQLTAEAGEVKLQLSFSCVDLDEQGNSIQRVRKTGSHTLTIVPIVAWSDIIPDEALSALDQRIIKLDAQQKALEEMNAMIANTKADDLSYENDQLQLMANGEKIGSAVTINGCELEEDGLPIVDIDSATGKPVVPDTPSGEGCDCGCEDDVVVFDNTSSAPTTDTDKDVVEF